MAEQVAWASSHLPRPLLSAKSHRSDSEEVWQIAATTVDCIIEEEPQL